MKIIVNIFLALIFGWATLSQTIATTVDYYIVNGKDVVGRANDKGDTLKEKYQYSAYGEERDLAKGTQVDALNSRFTVKSNPYLYSSYYRDTESGMDYLRARYYSPTLMRFISRDTYDLENRYAYGNSDPINNFDPSGHNALSFILSTVGFIVGAASLIISAGTLCPSTLSILLSTVGVISGGISSVNNGLINTKDNLWKDFTWNTEDSESNIWNIVGVIGDTVSVVGIILSARALKIGKLNFTDQKYYSLFGKNYNDYIDLSEAINNAKKEKTYIEKFIDEPFLPKESKRSASFSHSTKKSCFYKYIQEEDPDALIEDGEVLICRKHYTVRDGVNDKKRSKSFSYSGSKNENI